jgi:hypothetical protein
LEGINRWLESNPVRNYGPLVDVTADSGGGMNANLFGGGFMHFDIEAFIDVVAEQEWQNRDNVQLFLHVTKRDAGRHSISVKMRRTDNL